MPFQKENGLPMPMPNLISLMNKYIDLYMYIFMKSSFPKYDIRTIALALQHFGLALNAFRKRALHILYIIYMILYNA